MQYKDIDYIEIDFQPVIDIKKDIYTSMGYSNLNSTLYGIDITNIDDLSSVITDFLSKKKYNKIIILNEGLFWYLNKENILNITNTFINLFENKNWIWITSDCPVLEKNEEAYKSVIADSAKVKKWGTFPDYVDFTNFFSNIGLVNIKYKLSSLLSYEDLASAQFFSIDREETLRRIDTYTDVAVLQLKK